jgi:beta-aspartyl-peptidase (threonine type)
MNLHRAGWLAAAAVALAPVAPLAPGQEAAAEKPRYAIVIHGGAGPWAKRTPEETAAIEKALEAALRRGQSMLAEGGDSLDAVEQTIRVLEDAPEFNAGKGATYTADGKHQLDASIMRGEDRAAGAVAAITVAKNPISVARRVMTDTRHVLLAADGADAFARQIGAELVPPDYFWTDKTRAEYEAKRKEAELKETQPKEQGAARRLAPAEAVDHYGTVGCVALDQQGNLAAGTSTGGLSMKQFGRVGDSPIVGAGTYADNDSCAVSGTGVGELFIRSAVAYDVGARMRYRGASFEEAMRVQVDERLPAETAGLIGLSASGEALAVFNTAAMPRGVADSSGRFEVRIERDEPAGK